MILVLLNLTNERNDEEQIEVEKKNTHGDKSMDTLLAPSLLSFLEAPDLTPHPSSPSPPQFLDPDLLMTPPIR
jgi:hypothetical protein